MRTVRAVYEGETLPVRCEGGFVRRPAPEAGLVIETEEDTVYVAWSEIESLRAKLTKRGRR